MLEFERVAKKPRQIGLTPLIDVVFLLIIFFMMSTSFVRTESMEMSFPQENATKPAAKAPNKALRVFIVDEKRLFFGETEMTLAGLKAQVRLAVMNDADRSILLLSGPEVSTQRLVSVLDDVYLMGGRNVSVAEWDMANIGPKVEPAPKIKRALP